MRVKNGSSDLSSSEALPVSWEVCLVGDFANLLRGITYKRDQVSKSAQENRIPILRANNISDGALNFDDLVFVNAQLVSDEQIIKKNDILFAMSSGSKHLVGKSAIAKDDFNGSFGAFLGLLRISSTIDKNFVFHFFQSNEFKKHIQEISKGTNINNLKRDHILKSLFPLPPLPEQHRIVAKIEQLFSALDKGVAELKAAKKKLELYRQSLLKAAFEGRLTEKWRQEHAGELETAEELLARIKDEREKRYQQQLEEWQQAVREWEARGKPGRKPTQPRKPGELPSLTEEELGELPELPEGWGWQKLGLMTTGVEYGTSTKSQKTGKIPVLRMGNIQNFKFDWSDLVYTSDDVEIEKYWLRKGDVLFNRTNSPELVGKTAIFNGERQAIFAGYLIRINQISSIIDSRFLNYFLNSPYAITYGNLVKTDGVNQSNINGEKLINYPFPYCLVEEQKAVSGILESHFSVIDHLAQTIDQSLAQADLLRQAILKKAFSGRLVPQDPDDEPASELLKRIKAEREAVKVGLSGQGGRRGPGRRGG